MAAFEASIAFLRASSNASFLSRAACSSGVGGGGGTGVGAGFVASASTVEEHFGFFIHFSRYFVAAVFEGI